MATEDPQNPSAANLTLQLQHQGLDSATAQERPGWVFFLRVDPRSSPTLSALVVPLTARRGGQEVSQVSPRKGELISQFLQGFRGRIVGGPSNTLSLRPVGITSRGEEARAWKWRAQGASGTVDLPGRAGPVCCERAPHPSGVLPPLAPLPTSLPLPTISTRHHG